MDIEGIENDMPENVLVEEEVKVADTAEGAVGGEEMIIPSTPLDAVADSSTRKSARPRKPKSTNSPVDESLSKKKEPKRKSLLPKSVSGRSTPPVDCQSADPKPKRQYTKRKSVSAPADTATVTDQLTSSEPPVKKVRKSAAPEVLVVSTPKYIDSSGPADAPPVVDGEGDIVIVTELRKKKKVAPADVPPIECLKVWTVKAKRIVRRVHVVPSGAADIPPEPTADSDIIMPLDEAPATEEAVTGDKSVESPEKKSKKQQQQDELRKSQPSVLKFLNANKAESPEISDDSKVSVPVTPAVRGLHYTTDSADLAMYIGVWTKAQRRQLGSVKRKSFIQRTRGGGPVRVLDVSELSSKKASVYCGGRRLENPRPVYIAIHDRERPPVRLIMTHRSVVVAPRRPLSVDAMIDYEKDSDEEYEEEKEGEDLNSNADAEEDAAEGDLETAESEADSFFVSDGHFSDDDALSDDEAVVARRRRSEMSVDSDGKATLQLVSFGPADLVDADTDYSQEPLHARWFKTLQEEAVITILDPVHYFNANPVEEMKKPKPLKIEKPPKPEKPTTDWAAVRPMLARFVHGKSSNIDGLCAEFKGMFPEISANAIKTEIRTIAAWTKKPELSNRVSWFVKPELFSELGVGDEEMLALVQERKVTAPVTTVQQSLVLKPVDQTPVEDREIVRN